MKANKYILAIICTTVSTAFAAKTPAPPPNPVITYSAGTELHIMDADGQNNILLNKWAGFRVGFEPKWSPDRSQIVFFGAPIMNQPKGIWRVNADGTDYQLLVIAQAAPSWSPCNVLGQGEKIVFSYPEDAAFINPSDDLVSPLSPYDIYVMNPDGSGLAKLATTPELDEHRIAWSPDGTKLAVLVTIAFPIHNVFIYDLGVVDGKLQVTQMRDIHEEANRAGITLPSDDLIHLDWANHSDVLAIYSYENVLRDGLDGPTEIWLLDLNTFATRSVIKSAQLPGCSPSFSPDDSKLVFSHRSDSKRLGGIYCINADGTGLKKLATATYTMGVDWAK